MKLPEVKVINVEVMGHTVNIFLMCSVFSRLRPVRKFYVAVILFLALAAHVKLTVIMFCKRLPYSVV
jgi:hypothetical protein